MLRFIKSSRFKSFVITMTVLCFFTLRESWAVPKSRVGMQGSIIDTACAIDMGSRYQLIEMPALPMSAIVRDGIGPKVPFSIRLINCSLKHHDPKLPDWFAFQVTFDGSATHDGLFSVGGHAMGIGIRITDESGKMAIPGNPMDMQRLEVGSMEMRYTLNLARNHEHLQAGDYSSIIRFKLDYF